MIEISREEDLRPRASAIRYFDCTPDWAGKGRTTESYEFSYYLSGGGVFRDNGERFDLKEGCWRFTRPGHAVDSAPSYRCLTLRFSLWDTDEEVRCPFLDAIPVFFQSRDPEGYETLLKEIEGLLFSPEAGAGIRRQKALFTLLDKIYRDSATLPAESPADRCVREAREYLSRHFKEEVTLKDLGARFGYHPLYFQRLFRERTGATPHEYLAGIRLSHAKSLLSATQTAVGAVAEACGFGSVSHFSATFQAATGLSPTAFRKKFSVTL